jgi:hypothetical protein
MTRGLSPSCPRRDGEPLWYLSLLVVLALLTNIVAEMPSWVGLPWVGFLLSRP